MSTTRSQVLLAKGFIRPNLYNGVLEVSRFIEERKKVTPNLSYYAVGGFAALMQGQQRATRDIDIRVSILGDAEKLAIQTRPGWELWANPKKPHQIKAMIQFGDDPDKVKIDALLVPSNDFTIFNTRKLITSVEGISVASPALLAITKLETLAVRGNAIKLPNDYADLIWCLKECQKLKLDIPKDALEAGFPAGWVKMYTRLRKVVDEDQVAQLTKLLKDLGLSPQVPK